MSDLTTDEKRDALRALALALLQIGDELEAGDFELADTELNLLDVAVLFVAEQDPRVAISAENIADAIDTLTEALLDRAAA